jgi:NADH-quinone oxidoreductase subunit J
VAIAGIAALMILFTKEVFNAAVLLLVCLLAIAAIYILLNAEFIAVVQVMVYAGGILLLIMFGIMLTSKAPLVASDSRSEFFYIAVAVGVALVSLLWLSIELPQQPPSQMAATPDAIGMELVTSFSAPFELAGILLLISLIAAMTIASHRKHTNQQ